jgi:ABC-type transporter Mla subunit MlaD
VAERSSSGLSARVVVPAVVALAIAVAVGLAVFGGGTSDSHYLEAGFANAQQMTPGQQVRIAGRPVGEISGIHLDKQSGTAVVTLKISDADAWPLPKGSYAVARWGSNTAYLGRYTEIIPGPAQNPPLPDGGILTERQDQTAFELDQAYNIFRGSTAKQTQTLLNQLGKTLNTEGPALQRGVRAAPGGLDQAANLLDSLSQNEYDLKLLATAGDRTLTALNQRSSQLQTVVATAAGTFDTFAAHTAAEQSALAKANPSLTSAQTTFTRLDTSLGKLTTLVDNLRPGVPRLARLATTADAALTTLRKVAPQATDTLNSGIVAAPHLSKLFTAGDNVFPSTTRALKTATPMVACVRPYTPDIAGFLTTWSGFTSHYDANGHYGRTFELTVLPALLPGTANNAATAISQSPGITYAFPRPPGLNQGHPYYIPQCGITAAALNPADDPESHP